MMNPARTIVIILLTSAAHLCLTISATAGEGLAPFIVDSTAGTGIRDIHISGGYGYASIQKGMMILDVSDASNPQFVSKILLPALRPSHVFGHYRIVLQDQYAFVPMWSGGIYVIDVSDPMLPMQVNHLAAAGRVVRELAVYQHYLYAGGNNETGGLIVYDISNPASPALLGFSADLNLSIQDIEIIGSHAYVAAFRVYVFDLIDPSLPQLVYTLLEAGRVGAIHAHGNRAYVADQSTLATSPIIGVGILDVSTSSQPVLLGHENAHADDVDVFVDGPIAYVANNALGLHAVDLSRPDSPYAVRWFAGPIDGQYSVVKHGAYVYVSSDNAGLVVYPLNERGDCDGNGIHTSADIIWLVNFVFKGGPDPIPTIQGDTNCVENSTSADIIFLVNYIFKGGPTPACP